MGKGEWSYPLMFHPLHSILEEDTQLIASDHRHCLRACVDALGTHYFLETKEKSYTSHTTERFNVNLVVFMASEFVF